MSPVQRYLPVANDGLPEVHWGACQQAVVDFMFAVESEYKTAGSGVIRFQCIIR